MFNLPLLTPLTNSERLITDSWRDFFQELKTSIGGIEKEIVVSISNNVTATDLDGVSIDRSQCSVKFFDYLIQRVTDASEEVEAGTFTVSYLPDSEDYQLSNGPSSAGVTLTVTSAGQIQYATSNLSGTESISRIIVKPRKIYAKSSLYSKAEKGGRL